ncbi:hypothetical protein BASA50_003652 [Batrachochytrium salamandrivorans]|uniref:GH18 domain-containing protein n=1 Tax=Batrachochytrium salamandrivorans TaxID=1357716 RepID=A0ABQ8FIG8_9FUNG|nr:hypothetical protein BASA50_003652 [Batrachochytrium salamandrivorans]KAH6600791.1 hypothetical protein BASA61_002209 [Batrachochytrium salamandrivorans]KAH9257470.1 hypothetical protein BASA81_004399 [Batrachochytrium salamandrivorans]KAH9276304.1 hypothetical protein BASA83_000985 [Batrachochytrium salamandrivorans]KAJ1334682.1 hypothetical protein BSLG_007837 [Batrachochytrium salamandrivorans]
MQSCVPCGLDAVPFSSINNRFYYSPSQYPLQKPSQLYSSPGCFCEGDRQGRPNAGDGDAATGAAQDTVPLFATPLTNHIADAYWKQTQVPLPSIPTTSVEDNLMSNPPSAAQVSYGVTGKKLILYHTNWATYDRKFQVRDLPINYISDINYAFIDLVKGPSGFYVPTLSDDWADKDKRFQVPEESVPPLDPSDNGVPSQQYFGNFGQFRNLKQLQPNFSLGMSIGGWSFSKHFSEAVSTPPARQAFVQGVVDLLHRFPGLFQRVDIDWEHVSPPGENYGDGGNGTNPKDGEHFGLFLQLLRSTLDSIAALGHVTITACVTGDPSRMSALPLEIMVQTLASINVMTYDFASSSWGPTASGHQTNLFSTPYASLSVHNAVEGLLARNVPPHKIVIGVTFYSRGFASTDGLGQPSSGVVQDKSWEEGVCDYHSLPRPGASEFWDPQARATYSYDPVKRELNSYDSVESVREKCKYVWDRGLQGIIVWDSSGDHPVNHPRSLTAALYNGLARDPR